MIKRTLVATVAGGTAANLGGGKFANGAISSAFSHLFNSEASWEKINNFANWDLEFRPYAALNFRSIRKSENVLNIGVNSDGEFEVSVVQNGVGVTLSKGVLEPTFSTPTPVGFSVGLGKEPSIGVFVGPVEVGVRPNPIPPSGFDQRIKDIDVLYRGLGGC